MSTIKYSAIIFFSVILIALTLPAFYYSRLPETVASHFNFKSEPDAWMSKQTFLSIHVGLILFMSFLFSGIAFVVTKLPRSIINVPNKDYWLSDNKISETQLLFQKFMLWFGSITIGFLTLIMQEVYETNISGKYRLTSSVWYYLVLILIITAFLVVKLILHFKKIDHSNQTDIK